MSLERLRASLADRYAIERELGQGGMATVYLAEDLKHGRKVAIKVLRPELAAVIGAERFLREIKTIATLQHPHILGLIDSGEVQGTAYYVMPFVEGESLRDRLTREKQLPISDAVRIASEVAAALDYAHRHGVIHRDIKPENILLHDGSALVADFGIALAVSSAGGSTRMTETGMSLGTPHYMAPEQAMGERDITARADIYALGAVLYEMLVAEPPFQGPTAQAIVARVMTEEPRSLTLQRRTIPPHIEAAVFTALAKLPADRFASASQFTQALGNPGFASTATMSRSTYLPVKNPRDRIFTVVPWVLLAIVSGLLAWSKFDSHELPPPPILRMGLELPAGALWEDQTGASLALSADGTMLAYNGRDSTGGHLFLRAMDRVDPVPIAGTAAANQPAFSADGRWIGYAQSNKIYRVPVAGGTAETMCSLATGTQTTFTWFDTRSVVVADTGGLRLCSMDGGSTRLYQPDSTDQIFWPHTLPNRRGIVFSIRKGNDFELGLYDVGKHVGRSLGIVGTNPRYVTAGFLVYATLDGLIRAIRFDLRRLTVSGEPSVVMQGARVGTGGAAKIAVAPTGTMVTSSGQSSERVLELVNRSGAVVRVRLPPGPYGYPRFSPDGRQVAVVLGDVGNSNVWLYDRGQGTLTRLTFDSGASRPTWTNNGTEIVFARVLGSTSDLRIIKADGSASAESLLTVPGKQLFQALFTPDGRTMVVRTTTPSTRDIWRVFLDSTRVLRPLLTSPADERGVALSPDGHWMAYASDESGRFEVYVRAYPSMAARYQVSLDGGLEPVWSRQDNEILYRNGPVMLSARVRTSPKFEVVGREAVFSNSDYTLNTYEPNYDLAPDGRELLMVRSVGHSGGLGVTLNWFENLRAGRVGGGAGASSQ